MSHRFAHDDVTYPAFPIFSFFGFILPLIPLPWHLQAWNSGTCWYIFWASLSSLNYFVNSIVWAGNTHNWAPWWCEISTRIIIGSTVGLPAASLCINRRLWNIARVRAVVITVAEKRRAVLIDSLICGLFPAIYIAVSYVVQGHRFNILEDIGCYPAIVNTIPTFLLSNIWPIIVGLVSGVYAVLSLRAFSHRRTAFSQFLSSHTALTPSRYLRLSALASVDLLLSVPLGTFSLIINATGPLYPWVSWADTHSDFGRVEEIPHVFWAAVPRNHIGTELSRWFCPLVGLIFFAFFGFAAEARKHYRQFFNTLLAGLWRTLAVFGITRSMATVAPKTSELSAFPPDKGSGRPSLYPTISLPSYSMAGTGASTGPESPSTTDLKRAESLASVSTLASRFVESFDANIAFEMAKSDAMDVQTPSSTTSFASSSISFPLPHASWHTQPYPAVLEAEEDQGRDVVVSMAPEVCSHISETHATHLHPPPRPS